MIFNNLFGGIHHAVINHLYPGVSYQ
jgi:hypothetical protein